MSLIYECDNCLRTKPGEGNIGGVYAEIADLIPTGWGLKSQKIGPGQKFRILCGKCYDNT